MMIEMMKISDFSIFKNPPGRVLELLQLRPLLPERFLPYTLAQSKNSGSNLLMKVHH
jgi:hypothetical protein